MTIAISAVSSSPRSPRQPYRKHAPAQRASAFDDDGAHASSQSSRSIERTRSELLAAVAPLDRGAAAAPNDRERVESLTRELETVAGERNQLSTGSQPLFQGSWRLIYSSIFADEGPGSQGYSGTPVAPPGFMLQAVRQSIALGSDQPQCDNQVEFAGPFGAKLTATLEHSLQLDGATSRISLLRVSVNAGSNLFSLPELNLPSPSQFIPEEAVGSDFTQRASTFDTTYIDDGLRVSRSGLSELRIFVRDSSSRPPTI